MWFSFSICGGDGTGESFDDKMVNGWKEHLRNQKYTIKNEISRLQRLDTESQNLIKSEYLDRPRAEQDIILKEVARVRKRIGQLYEITSLIKTVENELVLHVSRKRLNQIVGKAANIMKHMNMLVSVPQISQVAKNFAKELEKAGIIDELINDTIKPFAEEEEEESIDDALVEAVFKEITSQPRAPVPVPVPAAQVGPQVVNSQKLKMTE